MSEFYKGWYIGVIILVVIFVLMHKVVIPSLKETWKNETPKD